VDRPSLRRYREIANALHASIRDGRFPVGSRLPSEEAIAREFEVSRNTARHAVQQLERLGMVTRNRGGGTTVVRSKPESAFVNSISSIDDILQYASLTQLKVRRVRVAVAVPIIEGRPPPERPQLWTQIEGVRYPIASETPLCWTDVFLHPEFADVTALVGHSTTPIYQLMEQRHGLLIKSVTQVISGALVPPDIADALFVRPGTAALRVTRGYFDLADRPVEVSVNLYAADRFTYQMTILRGQ
jgi:GntR family transcriptional regulator